MKAANAKIDSGNFFISQQMRIPSLNILAGSGLVFLGAGVGAGWLTHTSSLVQLAPGFAAMEFPAAFGFVIAGIALIVTRPVSTPHLLAQPGSDSPSAEGTRQTRCAASSSNILAGILMLLGVLALIQWARDIDIGIGQASLATWLTDTNLHPERVRPIAALGFILIGLATFLFNRAKTARHLLVVQLLTLAIGLVGVLGVIWQTLRLEDVYEWHLGIALHAGGGFVICSIGMLDTEFRDDRYKMYWAQDGSRKVSLIGGVILIMTGLIGVFGGFSVLHPQAVSELENNLQLSLKSRSDKFRDAIDQGWLDSYSFANQPLRLEAMRTLNLEPGNSVQRERLKKVAESSSSFGFSAVVFRNAAGREIAHAGSFASSPEISVTVNTSTPSHLLWMNGFILRLHINMLHNGNVVGTMDAERRLLQLGKELHDTANLGKTTDFAVCAPAGEDMHCFPFRSTGGKALINLPSRFNGRPIPMSHALAGESGTIHTKDYRGREVIAAYAPIGALGLGTVLKIDAAELYEPIASTLRELLAILFILVTAGIVLLRLQVLPLVRQMAIEINERKKAEKKISFIAHHDSLTGLPNRLLARDRLNQAMAYADRHGAKAALLFLDLDQFKAINDSLGHSVGDAVLQVVATRLRECVRTTDTVGRQGGDEFLIVLNDVSGAPAIVNVTEKILARQAEPLHVAGIELSISPSIGIAVYPDDGRDIETLLKKADVAMYQAKEGGRNTFRFYTSKMGGDAMEHLHTRHGLKKALERGEFILYYQPQVDLASNRVVGAEALIRWNRPDVGMVSPERFISIAEESGLILPIGDWVLKEACRQAVVWHQAGLPEMVIAVNLSAVQFKRGDLVKGVSLALAESGLPPACLELELTESILIQDTENVLATIRQLKALGVQLSIDDFGTGYSSLSYLKRFAVDKLKIDQSFVHDMVDDQNDAAIVRAIIQVAKTLNLRTIAEGVEEEKTLAVLNHYQCDEAQGYYFSQPIPADDLLRYLLERRSS